MLPASDDLWRDAAERVEVGRLADVLCRLVSVPSPTGEEAPLAAVIVDMLAEDGIAAETIALDERQASAIGRMPGARPDHGKRLLLYSPIDTVTVGTEAEDVPWIGPELRPEMRPIGEHSNGHVFGLGAHNPKGHAACIIETAHVLRSMGVGLSGDVLFGFGAGGMPTDARPRTRADSGHGVGCDSLLSMLRHRDISPDCAIIAKSGWAVAYEEVGLLWLEVQVSGVHNYVGSRHLMPYRNPLVDAALLISHLEDWLEDWPETQKSGLVAPQGVISYIEGGWERMPAFTPALCRFRIDLRLSPRTSADEAERLFREKLTDLCEAHGIDARAYRLIAIPGTATSADAEVITHTVAAWEAVAGCSHAFVDETSGATDANIIRMAGVPTARVGLPKARLPDMDFQLGMNAVDVDDMVALTHVLLRATIGLCGTETMQ